MTGDSADAGRGSVLRLIYRSRLTVPPDDYRSVIADILEVARRKNAAAGITGALVVWDESVVQTLEGDDAAVRGLYETISRDSRHDHVELVEERPGVERTFAKWSMAQVSDEDTADVPLGANAWEGGTDVKEMRVSISPDQEAVIATMRDRVRGASSS